MQESVQQQEDISAHQDIRPATQQSSRQFRISKTQASIRQKPQSQGGFRNKNTEKSKNQESTQRPKTQQSHFFKQQNAFGEWIHPGLQPDLKFAYEHCDTGLAHYTGGQSMGLFSQQDSQISQMRTENRILFMKQRLPRQIDNHFDNKVHHLPWIASGKEYDSKCDIKYDDSGLAPILKDKITLKLFQQKEQIEKTDPTGLRVFREQNPENMNDGMIVVTIEYCANCKFHGGTTRHDEEKYQRVSENLKISINRHFPNVYVFLKPNTYSLKDKNSESAFIRTRIGACDVQIATKINKDKYQKGILHSKLASQCWPNQEKILDKIREYQPITDISVQIYTRDPDDKDKLKNLEVSLRPFRNPARDKDPSPEGNDRKQQIDFHKHLYSHNSPSKMISSTQTVHYKTKQFQEIPSLYKYNYQRPTNETVKYNALHKRRLQSNPDQTKMSKDDQNLKTGKIDENGKVVFQNMPYDIYQVEVAETQQFRKLQKKFSVFQKLDNKEEIFEKFRLQPQGTKCEQTYKLFVSLSSIKNGGKEIQVRYFVKIQDEWKFEGQTENKLDPNQEFETFFVQQYNLLELQEVQFKVFDSADNLIGCAFTTMGEIVSNQIPTHMEQLIKDGKYAGDIFIKTKGKYSLQESEISFQLQTVQNQQLQNPFIVLRKVKDDRLITVKKISSLKQQKQDQKSQKSNEAGNTETGGQEQPIKGDQVQDQDKQNDEQKNYLFEKIIVKFSELTNSDDQNMIIIELHDQINPYKTLQIDELQINMKEIREGDKSFQMNSGLLTFNNFEEKEKFQFLQYLEGGTDLKHLNLLDFTSLQKDEQRLHPKQYTKALGQLCEILIPYDQDRKTQALGIGIDEMIQKKQDDQQEDQWRGFVFLLNKNGHADIQGSGKDVVEVYKHYLSNKNILKPRELKGALNSAILNIQSCNNAYSSILIYMDGKPKDFQEIQEIFQTLSNLAVSVVFVGIGGDIEFLFTDMQNKLENLEAQCKRDFLQFIYMNSSDIKGDTKKLSSSVLSQIPYQGEQYFDIHNIKPQLPLSEMESYSETVKLQLSVNYLDMGLDGSNKSPQVVLFLKNPKTNQLVAKGATEKAINTLNHTFDDLITLIFKFETMNELVFHVYDLKNGESYETKDPILICTTTDQNLIGQISKDEQIFTLTNYSKNKDNLAAQLSVRIMQEEDVYQEQEHHPTTENQITQDNQEEIYEQDPEFKEENVQQENKNQEQQESVQNQKQFLTFIQKGFSLSSVIGISFCNTLPVSDPKSLHFYSELSQKENDYQKILSSLPQILSHLNTQQCVSIYGYNQNLFNLSGVDNQTHFRGGQSIIKAYQQTVQTSQIADIQENISLVLQKAIDEAKISKDCLDQNSTKEIEFDTQKVFTVAYLFINGKSVDSENIKNQLVSIQEYPIIVFIVNVGRDECLELRDLYDHRSDYQISNFHYINYNQLRRSDKIINNFTLPLIPQQMTNYYKKYPQLESNTQSLVISTPQINTQIEKEIEIIFFCDDLDFGDIFDVYQKNPENDKWWKFAAYNTDQMKNQEAVIRAVYKFQEMQEYKFVLKNKDSSNNYSTVFHQHTSLGQIVRGVRKNDINFQKKDGTPSKILIDCKLAQQDTKDYINIQWNLYILKQIVVQKEEKKKKDNQKEKEKEQLTIKKESKTKKKGKKEEEKHEIAEEEEPPVEDVINRYLRFYKRTGQTENYTFILKSDALTQFDNRLQFQVSVKTTMDKLTDKSSPFIKIEVCEQLNQEEEKVVGTSVIEFQKLLQGNSYFKVDGMEALIFMGSMVSAVKMSYFEYLMSGMCMNVSVAIDFTASNGSVNNPYSLHYYDAKQKDHNQYQKAMQHLVQIILEYDNDKKIALNGFGADLSFPNQKGFSNYFNLTGDQEQIHVNGLKEMMQTYINAMKHLTLSGPTNLAPVLNGVINQAQRSVKIYNSKLYQISLILTDGQFMDTKETQDAVVQASKLPISIIIVVIGNLKLSALQEMRETLLTGVKDTVAREVIQIIRFVDLKEDRKLLGKMILPDIPKQLEQYYQINKILPTLKIKLNNYFQTIFFKYSANFKIIRDCYITFFIRDTDDSWLQIGESETIQNQQETFNFTKEVFFFLQFGKKQELKIEVNEREGDKDGKKNNKKFNVTKKEIYLSDFIKQGTVKIDLIDQKLEKKSQQKKEEKKDDKKEEKKEDKKDEKKDDLTPVQETIKPTIDEPIEAKYGEAIIDICNSEEKGFFQFLQRKDQYRLITGFEIGDQEKAKFAQEIVQIFQDSLDIYNKQEEKDHKQQAIQALESAIQYCQTNQQCSVICVLVMDSLPEDFESFKKCLSQISELKLRIYIYGLKSNKDLREAETLDGMCGQKVNFVKQYSSDETPQVLAGKVVPSLGYAFN